MLFSPKKMAISIIFISIIFIFVAYKSYKRLKYKLPPGPSPWPVLGNLYNLEPDFSDSLYKWSLNYGPIISVWLCSTLNVVVSNSELAQQVLKDKDQLSAHRPRNKPLSIMSKNGNGLLWADYGPNYIKLRKICTLEFFSPKGIEAVRSIREGEVREMIKSIFNYSITNPSKCLLLRKFLQPVVSNSVTMLLLGKRFFSVDGVLNELGLQFKEISNNEMKIAISLFPAEHIWWLSWIFTLRSNVFSKHLARRDKLIQSILMENKKGKLLSDFQKNYALTENNIKELIWDVTSAGMETSTIVVEYAMAELVKNQRLQIKAQEEINRIIGLSRVMDEFDIPNLPFLRCIVKETLRLHPPAPLLLPHKANSDVKIGGYDIPKGTNVHVNVSAIGRDPEMWKDPLEFRPERFLEEDVEIKVNDFRLLPFGAGRRMCPAAQLGINLVTLMVGQLLHHFNWDLPDGVVPEDMDLSGIPGMASFLKTPLQVLPTVRLPTFLYGHENLDVE